MRRKAFSALAVSAVVLLGGTTLSQAQAAPSTQPSRTPAAAAPDSTLGTNLPTGPDGQPVPVSANIDGCDHNYADADDNANVCVPLAAPGGGTVDCAYIRAQHYHRLRIVGRDTKHLRGPNPASALACQ